MGTVCPRVPGAGRSWESPINVASQQPDEEVTERLVPLKTNYVLPKATIPDSRFYKLHFSSPVAVSNAISSIHFKSVK